VIGAYIILGKNNTNFQDLQYDAQELSTEKGLPVRFGAVEAPAEVPAEVVIGSAIIILCAVLRLLSCKQVD